MYFAHRRLSRLKKTQLYAGGDIDQPLYKTKMIPFTDNEQSPVKR